MRGVFVTGIWYNNSNRYVRIIATESFMARPVRSKKVTRKVRIAPVKNKAAKALSKRKSAPKRRTRATKKAVPQLALNRYEGNPIITPHEAHAWESKATFNPSAVEDEGKVHLVYRAIGDDDTSVIGYSSSRDGFGIDERVHHPVYAKPTSTHKERWQVYMPAALYCSGGGWNGGCEDPRLTKLGGRVYMTYTAFDSWNSVRIALTSIALQDLRDKKWRWKKPVFISPPREIHKNWVIFPEKIRGKYAILHTISPTIGIEYVESLDDFDGETFVTSAYKNKEPYRNSWDNWVRGAGPAPLKTKYGWLVLYHAMDSNDPNRYKLGAMILDEKNPTNILYRSATPVLEPDEYYENEGFKAGVIYSCGAVIKDGQLIVYYGGADTVVCAASADLDTFLEELVRTGKAHLSAKKGKTTKKK